MKDKNYPRWHLHRNQSSFAEKFFENVLLNNDIEYSREYAIKNPNNYNYYLDFYIVSKSAKIDLEIDGSQHKDPVRAKHDKLRDLFLTS